MSNVNETAQPNEKAHELEEKRKSSLNKFIKEKRYGKSSDEGDEGKEKSEKNEEKLDNKEKNSYINNKNDQEDSEKENKSGEDTENKESEDDLSDEYERVLQETFGGDPKKAVKSWKESQKNFTKLRKEKKREEQKLDYLNNLVEKNPVLGDIIKTAAEKGDITKEDLQNFLQEGKQEPSGKPNQASSKSKLEIVDEEGFNVNDIDEDTLVESGYLDRSKQDVLSSSEWSTLKRQAALNYAEDKLPQRLAQKAFNQFKQQIGEAEKQKKEALRQEKVDQTNAERYEQGMERIIDEFSLDFAGNEDHEQLLDEIESVAVNIRDPQDSDLIHKNAMYLATLQVAEDNELELGSSKNVDKEVEQARQEADESFDKRTGFNANTRQPNKGGEPETLAEKLAARNFEQYQQTQDKRRKTGRIPSSE